jgi:radical SAM protein with 4Fe4S-binding SPASM domain
MKDMPDCKLIFNHMTRAMVSMSYEEFDNIFNMTDSDQYDFLFRNYFLVEESYDEMAEIDKVRAHLSIPIDDKYMDELYQFLILPTTGCNARCFYCYERNMKKSAMTEETAEKVVQYICKKAKKKDRKITLRWFGGEPLFNMKIIRYIVNRLTELGYNFSSGMISNGYLFTEEIAKEAAEVWKLTNVQITLDGTEDVYNKAKNYIYKNQDEVSPYKKVIENIGYLVNNKIYISIRMNTDMYNAENLKELIKEIHERFPDNKYIGMYAWPIFEDEDNVRTDEDRKNVYEKIREIEEVLDEYGYYKGRFMEEKIRSHHCMVDGAYNVVISPNGELGLCEHYVDSDFWGHIDDDSAEKRDWSIIHSWRDYVKPNDICKECPRYPSCIRVKKCLDLKDCSIYHRDFQLRHDERDIVETYKRWLDDERNKRNNKKRQCSNGQCNNKNVSSVSENKNVEKETPIKTFKNKIKNLFNK